MKLNTCFKSWWTQNRQAGTHTLRQNATDEELSLRQHCLTRFHYKEPKILQVFSGQEIKAIERACPPSVVVYGVHRLLRLRLGPETDCFSMLDYGWLVAHRCLVQCCFLCIPMPP